MTEINPFLLRLRERQGRWGSFHRSNGPLIAAALMLHGLVAFGLYQGGWEAAMLVLLVFNGVVLLLAAVGVVGTIRSQVGAARYRNAWDELLVTPITSRQLVHGQLLLATRPAVTLFILSLPSQIALILACMIGWMAGEGILIGLVSGIVLLILMVVLYSLASLTILALGVIAFYSALSRRGFLARTGLALGGILVLLVIPSLVVVLLPVCWYHYRVLICSLREQLIEGK